MFVFILQMSSTVPVAPIPKKYRKYTIVKTWGQWQASEPSYLHSIENYYNECIKLAKEYPEDVMVLRQEVECITGWCTCVPGRPAQRTADLYGWTDVRRGKHYMTTGAFYEDME